MLESGIFPGGKENDKARQSVFLTPLIPFGSDPGEEEPHFDHTVPQKVHYETYWRRNQDAVDKIIWRSSNFRTARNTEASTQGFSSNRRTQQQQQQQQPQQPILDKDVACIWKQRATWESRVRDDTKHAKKVEEASRKLVRATSEADVGTHLSEKEVIADAFSSECSRCRTSKIGSNKMCFREGLAMEKMVFNKESSRAIFEMGNVELIELKKSPVQCPAYTTLWKEHSSANAAS